MNCSHVFDYIELFRIITTEELMQRTTIFIYLRNTPKF